MILVDTYNLLHAPAAARFFPDDAGPAELAGLIALGRHRAAQVILVCDGTPPPGWAHAPPGRLAELRYRVESVDIVFAGAGSDADTMIEAFIARDSAPKRLRVVSSDRRIIAAARRRGARSIQSDRFVHALLADVARLRNAWVRPEFAARVPLDAEAVRYWRNLFGIRENDLPPDPAPNSVTLSRPSAPSPARGTAQKRSDPVVPPASATPPTDPILLAALQEWRDRLSLDDLDMTRWLRDPANSDPPNSP